jgi:hypothetical protein
MSHTELRGLVLLLRILEVTVQISVRRPAILTDVFSGFPQTLQEKCREATLKIGYCYQKTLRISVENIIFN